MTDTPRSSSLVENLNSRLRTYFTMRRHLGGSYLDLLRFFLNHRRFVRSRHAERQGKSPRELMTGQGHPHWLTLLAWDRFSPSRLDHGEARRSLPHRTPFRSQSGPHRPALSARLCNPKRADSEPRQKSFSSVSSPIFACSSFRST